MLFIKQVNVELGRIFKKLRIQRGLTTKLLAEDIGCSQSQISYLESGKRGYSDKLFNNFCNYFGVEPNNIYYNACVNAGVVKGDK